MTKSDVMGRIRALGLVPILRVASASEALRAVDAIRAGGVDVLEITLTVPGALGVIEELARRHPDAITGAGTVLDAVDARAAIERGACFLVSPGFDAGVMGVCREHGVAVFPGALTPTEVITAWRAGADMVKIFPAGAVGGAAYLKALKGPLPEVEMIPTGGVSAANAADFIRAGAAAIGVGGELVDTKALAEGRGHVVTERARELVRIVREAR
jgi:2-dehydro-3-deoxyphosphogluconate aldolase/(4S)-4-hydroxy-2-oxoglutarate aldolase